MSIDDLWTAKNARQADDSLRAWMSDSAGSVEEFNQPGSAVRRAGTPDWASPEDYATVMEAFRYAFRTRNEAAITTHYFNPARGGLERTLNHPYLGLYPLSYMVKSMRELARFLLVRPFGLNAPLVGYEAFRQVGEALAVEMQENPDFAQFVKDNQNLIYALQMFIPGNPYESPINAPAWARHIVEGRAKDLPRYIGEVPGDTVGNIGIGRDARLFANAGRDIAEMLSMAGQDIGAQLDAAARAYDSSRY